MQLRKFATIVIALMVAIAAIAVITTMHVRPALSEPVADELTVIQFYGNDCTDCPQQRGSLDRFTRTFEGRLSVQVADITVQRDLAQKYNVTHAPSTVLVRKVTFSDQTQHSSSVVVSGPASAEKLNQVTVVLLQQDLRKPAQAAPRF